MCIIAASFKGDPQPSLDTLRRCFTNNPHGAGYMVAREGRVEISKGYMDWASFARAIRYEAFTPDDAVVYHFRISTQAGVNPYMTHPFPLTPDIASTRLLELACPIGAAHNGIIRLTTDPTDKTYSDTAHYVSEYLAYLVRDSADLHNDAILAAIENTTNSKWALMDGTGYIALIGGFHEDGGIWYSNYTYQPVSYKDRGGVRVYAPPRKLRLTDEWEDFEQDELPI